MARSRSLSLPTHSATIVDIRIIKGFQPQLRVTLRDYNDERYTFDIAVTDVDAATTAAEVDDLYTQIRQLAFAKYTTEIANSYLTQLLKSDNRTQRITSFADENGELDRDALMTDIESAGT